MPLKSVLLVIALALVVSACGSAFEPEEVVLADAERVGPGVLTDGRVAALADLQPADELYRLDPEGGVFVRVRDGAPPLLFATDCAALFRYELVSGWDATCTRRVTEGGGVEEGVFLYRIIE